MTRLSAFKSYDIRGQVGTTLTVDMVRDVGRAFVAVTGAMIVVIGRDARDSSPMLADAIAEGVMQAGADVLDLGLCGTEEVYFATDHLGAGGGLMITASHNPIGDNGIKMVRDGARPISWAGGLGAVHDMVVAGEFEDAAMPGTRQDVDVRADYVARVLSFIDPKSLPDVTVLVNAGNGAAGPTFDALADALALAGAPVKFHRLHHTPDPTFPNGIPNPLLIENRPPTANAVTRVGAAMGVAWDGDFDRCFLFDESGGFIAGEYVVGLLAAATLAISPHSAIVFEPRVVWNTENEIAKGNGRPVVSKTGHALIKQSMREEDAAYGGEMSAHHYFRDFMYCDSGMIPWLLVLAHMGQTGQPLSQLVGPMQAAYPSSGELNFLPEDPDAAIARIEAAYLKDAASEDRLDGISLAFSNWRLNLRRSNTENYLRLNIETRGDKALLEKKVLEISALIRATG